MRRGLAPERCEVIVVGGGPAGAAAARAATREGCEVILVERHGPRQRKVCGEYLCPGGVQRLEALGFGDALEAAQAAPLRGMRLFPPSGREVPTLFPEGRPGLSISRHDLDARLATASGARVRRGRKAAALDLTADCALLRLEDGTVLRAAVVIGADGRNSVVARRRGLHLTVGRRPRAAVHAYYADVEGRRAMGEMHLPGDGSYIGLNPGADGLVNLTYVCDLADLGEQRPARTLARVLATVPSLRERFAGACLVGRPRVLAPLEVLAARTHDERVLLAGDAAGSLDPLTGEGIYGAIATGELAGRWAAHAVRTGRTGRRDLAGYSRERRRLFGSKTALNRSFQWMLRRPRVLEYLGNRLRSRQGVGDALIGVIGNAAPPTALLRPRNLLGLILP